MLQGEITRYNHIITFSVQFVQKMELVLRKLSKICNQNSQQLLIIYRLIMLVVFFNYEYKRIEIEFQLSIFIVYDLEVFDTSGAVPYCVSLYRLSEVAPKYDRVL